MPNKGAAAKAQNSLKKLVQPRVRARERERVVTRGYMECCCLLKVISI